MGAAFEVNRQMCDLERGLSNDFLDMKVLIADKLAKDVIEGVRTPDWVKNMLAGIPEQLSRAEYEILEEILKEKNRFMEEKKTKKMTKAEAFEWLKGKKVSVSDEEMNDRIQSKLFACGVQWKNGGNNVCYYSNYLVISPHGFLCHCDGMGEDYWNRLFHEEISADDILSIEVVEEEKEPKRFSDYVAIFQSRLTDNEVAVITKTNFIKLVK